jgi:hypothetical protein
LPNLITLNIINAYTNTSTFGKLNIAQLRPIATPLVTSHLNVRKFSQVLIIWLPCIHHKQEGISHYQTQKKRTSAKQDIRKDTMQVLLIDVPAVSQFSWI